VKIKLDIAALGRSKWYEYLVRFAFGGAVTALAGIIAKRWGPEIGGLFLAFPAIFPATATLLEKHEKQKKLRTGKSRILRAREIAGVDAAGAAMGSLGLRAFAVIVWRCIADYPVAIVLFSATLAWSLVTVLMWGTHQRVWRILRARLLNLEKRSAQARFSQESPENRKVR
jgi:hypothetical protein